jgi:hypothetical protein
MKKLILTLIGLVTMVTSFGQTITGTHTGPPKTGNTYITERFVVKPADNQYVGSKVNGTTYYDSTKHAIKVYHQGNINGFATYLNTNNYVVKLDSLSGTGSATIFKITHPFKTTPIYYNVVNLDTTATIGSPVFFTADTAFVYVHYTTAPPNGTKNLIFRSFIIKQ